MARRWGLGPVFAYEWLINARRWQLYALRSLFVAALLVGLCVVWWSVAEARNANNFRALARAGQSFFTAMVGIQLVLVLLAAPAATAGAICLDKARGTLLHLLVTDLSDAEIVLGKLAARLIPALGLVACGLPVVALGTLLGGIDPWALFGAFLVTVGVAVLGCALALTISVWGTKTHEVLLGTYLVWGLWLLLSPALWTLQTWGLIGGGRPDWLDKIEPFWLCFGPTWRPGSITLADQVIFLGAALAISVALTVLSVRHVRAVAVRQGTGVKKERLRWLRLNVNVLAPLLTRLPGPGLDPNPILWREWHRSRPSRWARIAWAIYVIVTVFFSFMVIFSAGGGGWRNGMAAWICGLQVSAGLLLLSVSAATALGEERVRGSLDVLLSTPMPTSAIVWGKWWGTYRLVPLLAVLPALLVGAMAMSGAPGRWLGVPLIIALILAQGAAVTSLGLALATWVSRIGRAVVLSVSAYVLVTVGWIFFLLVAVPRSHELQEGLMAASPFFGAGDLTFLAGESSVRNWSSFVGWVSFWTIAYLVAAGALLAATLVTFNRCLGRLPERGQAPLRKPWPPIGPTLDEPVWAEPPGALTGSGSRIR
jgi:ABC-type transport system involved in multi-copper enzyme maturation permease subunit